jgi:imidazole glycerol-phosphate synthase subunit HisF
MFRPRVIPVLLLKHKGLVKSVKFRNHRYIGDPINAVKLFNDLNADELVFLDILASREKRCIDLGFVKNVGEEANMPFAVGGGISTLEDIKSIILSGAEKVIINTAAVLDPEFIRRASETFGSSTITVCLDVKKNFFGKSQTWVINGYKSSGHSPAEFAYLMELNGAGELIIQSIERDGNMSGYDIELIKEITGIVKIPVIALGGAGNLSDLRRAYVEGHASGLAAGSVFIYQGPRKGILINYPTRNELAAITRIYE